MAQPFANFLKNAIAKLVSERLVDFL